MSRSKLFLDGVRILAHIQQPGRPVPARVLEPAAVPYAVLEAARRAAEPLFHVPPVPPWYVRVLRWIWRAVGISGSRSW